MQGPRDPPGTHRCPGARSPRHCRRVPASHQRNPDVRPPRAALPHGNAPASLSRRAARCGLCGGLVSAELVNPPLSLLQVPGVRAGRWCCLPGSLPKGCGQRVARPTEHQAALRAGALLGTGPGCPRWGRWWCRAALGRSEPCSHRWGRAGSGARGPVPPTRGTASLLSGSSKSVCSGCHVPGRSWRSPLCLVAVPGWQPTWGWGLLWIHPQCAGAGGGCGDPHGCSCCRCTQHQHAGACALVWGLLLLVVPCLSARPQDSAGRSCLRRRNAAPCLGQTGSNSRGSIPASPGWVLGSVAGRAFPTADAVVRPPCAVVDCPPAVASSGSPAARVPRAWAPAAGLVPCSAGIAAPPGVRSHLWGTRGQGPAAWGRRAVGPQVLLRG